MRIVTFVITAIAILATSVNAAVPDLPELQIRFDAAMLGTPRTDVTTWADSSGKGYDAVALGNEYPQYGISYSPNGREVVSFFGAWANRLGFSYYPNEQDISIIVVSKGRMAGSTNWSYGRQGPISWDDFGWSGLYQGINKDAIYINFGHNNYTGGNYPLTYVRPASEAGFTITTSRFAGGTETSTGIAELFVNGSKVGELTGIQESLNGVSDTAWLGGCFGQAGWDGDIAEILVYNKALTEQERTDIEAYLTTKWISPDPTISLPPVVNIGNDISVHVESPSELSTLNIPIDAIVATQDARPYTGYWEAIGANAANVSFANANSTSTTLSVTALGIYTIRYVADDGKLGFDDLQLTVSLSDGMVIHYTFDNDTGDPVIHDSSVNQLNGQLRSTASIVYDSERGNNVLSLPGLNYCDVKVGPDVRLDIPNQLTIMCWAKAEAIPYAWTGLVCKGTAANSYRILTVGSEFKYSFGTSGSFWVNQAIPFDTGWHHVAAVYDGSSAKIYMDGDLEVELAGTNKLFINTDALYIGSRGNGWPWQGAVDDFRLYNKSLSQQEIRTITGYNFAPSVDAGEYKFCTLPVDTIFMHPTVTDDNLPTGAALSYTWEVVNKPAGASVNFSPSANVINPTAAFSSAGDYELKLTVSDTDKTSSDTVLCTVYPEGFDGLVVSYNFDTAIEDSSINGLDGSLKNDAVITFDPDKNSNVLDLSGNSATMTGYGAYAEIPFSPKYAMRNNFTVMVDTKITYVYPQGWNVHLVSRGTGSWNIQTDGVLSRYAISLEGIDGTFGQTARFADGNWHNIIVTYLEPQLTVYVDGYICDQNTVSATSLSDNQLPLTIGARANTSGAWPWAGLVDNVRIYNRAWTENEVTEYHDVVYGDFDNDDKVNFEDFSQMAAQWNCDGDQASCNGNTLIGDLNGDCDINLFDLNIFVQNWLIDLTE
ncbi:MAG: hypothetical protein A2Y10_15290 [Planctomycetes bacterium GWF2_41_51]|nr:MAG: hypothetical protein A2Y10_15290 [Planctomycetes bacterium GWF2_41_51]HBG26965.1 hypothetical protein [Phycisphaerales bacterium]